MPDEIVVTAAPEVTVPPAVVADPPPAAADAPPVADKPPKEPWHKVRIDRLTWEKNEEKRQREAITAERDADRAELARLRASAPIPIAAAPSPAAPALSQAEMDRQVNERASQIARDAEFRGKANTTWQSGIEEFPDFVKTVENFNMLGGIANQKPLVEALISLPDGHRVLHHLASNMDEAARVMGLSPVQQAIEVTKLSGQLKAPKPSAAPPPVNPLQGNGGTREAGPDANGEFRSQDEFRAWRAAQRKKR